MTETGYNRSEAVRYALRWALARNPDYYDFADVGGDCTSFISQCVYAGCDVMNYTPTFGWYYISGNDKSPSWSGVDYFYDFIVNNYSTGPYGEVAPLSQLLPGDIIQLQNRNGRFYHSLILTMIKTVNGNRNYYICAHDNDAYQRNLNTYNFAGLRGIKILGART